MILSEQKSFKLMKIKDRQELTERDNAEV